MKKTVLITGGSKGIGYELACQFAADNHDLILVSRNPAELDNAVESIRSSWNVHVVAIAKDLSDTQSCKELYEEISSRKITISTLVNNAGFGMFGNFPDLDNDSELSMMRLNMFAPVLLTRLFFSDICAQKGSILNVASTAAFQPGPIMTVYYATKAFLLSFSEGLREELKPYGVRVSTLCPGPTLTDFQSRSGIHFNKHLFFRLMGILTAQKVAKIAYRDFTKGKPIIIPGLMNHAGAILSRMMPLVFTSYVIKKINEHKKPERQI